MLGILVDDDDPSAGPHDAAHLCHRLFDIHRMLQGFGGISRVESASAKGSAVIDPQHGCDVLRERHRSIASARSRRHDASLRIADP